MTSVMVSIECAEVALRQVLDAMEYLAKPEMGLANLAPKYLDASAEVLEQTARAFKSRALELRRAASGGIPPLPKTNRIEIGECPATTGGTHLLVLDDDHHGAACLDCGIRLDHTDKPGRASDKAPQTKRRCYGK